MSGPLLEVESLCVDYERPRSGAFGGRARTLRAVSDVSFKLSGGETLGIVGETGCGKTSLGKAILQLITPSAGRVIWRGADLSRTDAVTMTKLRSELQIVFQDPLSALNPRMPVGEIVGEPLRVHAADMSAGERDAAVVSMFERVGLRPEMTRRYPNEFSSGQCQRISIARAMISEPKLLVCDEPVSALDVSIQAQICNLLRRLQRETGIAILFISHDLSVVRYMSASGDGAVSRQADGNRAARRAVRKRPASLQPGTDRCDSRRRSRPEPARIGRHPAGRNTVGAGPALGLRIPHPLPDRHARMRARDTADREHLAGASRRLPPLAGNALRTGIFQRCKITSGQ